MISSRYFLDGERVSSEFFFSLPREQRESVDVFGETVGGSGEGEEKNVITISLSDQDGNNLKFRIKKDKSVQKVFEAYATRKGVALNELNFFFDGNPVRGEQTPKMLEMEDGDEIQVAVKQTGGSGEGEEKKVETITIVLSDQAGEKMQFKVKKDTKFQKIFDAYASRLGVPVNSLTFRFDGERITEDSTPRMMEMEDFDTIDIIDGRGEGEEKIITISLFDQDGGKINFRIKKDKSIQKVFEAYATRKGVALNELDFFFDGSPLRGELTPEMLKIKYGDKIKVKKMIERITVIVSDQAGEKVQTNVKKDTKFQKLFDAYASRLGVPVNSLTFRFDGERIPEDSTPGILEMEDYDTIEVLKQVADNESD